MGAAVAAAYVATFFLLLLFWAKLFCDLALLLLFPLCLRAKEFLHLRTKANANELKTDDSNNNNGTLWRTSTLENETKTRRKKLTSVRVCELVVCVYVSVRLRAKRLTQSVNKLSLEERWVEEALENHRATEEPEPETVGG